MRILLLLLTLGITLCAAPELKYYNALEAPFAVEGMPWRGPDGELRRLPLEMNGKLKNSKEVDVLLAYHTAGAVIRFRTNSNTVFIRGELHHVEPLTHMPVHGFAGIQMATETGLQQKVFRCCCPLMENCVKAGKSGFTGSIPIKGDYKLNSGGNVRDIALFLPLYAGVKSLNVGLDVGAVLEPPHPHKIADPVVFYGSSITQGCAASTPASCYSTLLCRELDAPQLNLGFSSSAHGEQAMAELIAEQKMSAFVMDYDYNASNVQELEERHYAFYKTIRNRQPELPIIILSGPRHQAEAKSRDYRKAVMATYDKAVKEGDRKVWMVDGFTYYRDVPWTFTTVDLTHPTNLGFHLMYLRILPVLKEALGVR